MCVRCNLNTFSCIIVCFNHLDSATYTHRHRTHCFILYEAEKCWRQLLDLIIIFFFHSFVFDKVKLHSYPLPQHVSHTFNPFNSKKKEWFHTKRIITTFSLFSDTFNDIKWILCERNREKKNSENRYQKQNQTTGQQTKSF